MTREKLGLYALICLGCLTISFNVAVISAIVPVISEDLMRTKFEVARIIPYYLVPYGFAALLYAPLVSRFRFRTVYVGMMGLFGLACLICARAGSLEAMLCGRILMGVTAAGAIPMGLIIIGDHFEKRIRGRLVGIFFSHAFVASILGLIVGGVMPWRLIFYIPAGLGVAVAAGFGLYRSGLLDCSHAGHTDYLHALRKSEILRVFLFIFCLSFLYHGVHKWYGVYLDQVYGFDQLTINMFVVLTVVMGMIGQVCGGFLSDLKGRAFTLRVGVTGLALSIMALLGTYGSVMLAAVLGLIALFWTIGHNGISTILTDFTDEDRPVIAGLNSSVRFISGGMGFILSKPFVSLNFGRTFFVFGCLAFLLSWMVPRIIPQGMKTS
ncbi:MAG: MFS transporter [Candidatus Omnitrophica bacterium]|nr:MFS transporter [Candidatus Omnitrophota bacterium]